MSLLPSQLAPQQDFQGAGENGGPEGDASPIAVTVDRPPAVQHTASPQEGQAGKGGGGLRALLVGQASTSLPPNPTQDSHEEIPNKRQRSEK